MEKLKYIKVLLRRGLRLASSSAIILIPTIVIYLIERTGTFGDETPAIIFSRYPLDFVIDVISHTKIPAGVGAAALLALLLLKSLTVYFVSEDIYRLREGEDRRRYSKILSTVRYQYVVRFLAFYASWHVLFFVLGMSILGAASLLGSTGMSWCVSVVAAAVLFPIYYAGVSLAGFTFAAKRCEHTIHDPLQKLLTSAVAIYSFYAFRSVIEVTTMLGIPLGANYVIHDDTLALTISIILLTPFIVMIRSTSQIFKYDILKPRKLD